MPTTFIASLTRASREALSGLGVESDTDLDGVYVPNLLEAGVSWGQVHRIVAHLTASGLGVSFAAPDETWTASRWREFVESLVGAGIMSWEEVAICVLGELNPPQVGTSLASNENIKALYPHREAMRAVMTWFYAQDGRCRVCGRRLHIEVDHVVSKDEFVQAGRNPAEADTLDNLQLLCKRCNVTKRESHKLGGLSFATAQAALMWILLAERPKTREAFAVLCRAHGLTMASIRFEEAWAMAIWLSKAGLYELDEPIDASIAEAVEEAVEDADDA